MSNEEKSIPVEPVDRELQLARLRASTEASLAKVAESATELRRLRIKDSVYNAVKASGVTFHPKPQEVMTLLEADFDVSFDEHGVGVVVVNGKQVTLAEGMQALALKHSSICDGRSLKKLRGELEDDGGQKINSRADLTTRAEHSAYIAKHGLQKYEMLPPYPVQTGIPKTLEEFRALPSKSKSELISEMPDGWQESLRSGDLVAQRNQTAGIRVNKTGR